MPVSRLYVPIRPSAIAAADIPRYLFEELGRISLAFDSLRSNLTLDELTVAPSKPVKGMIVLADGTYWNPDGLNGAGYYGYDGSEWVYFGTGVSLVSAYFLENTASDLAGYYVASHLPSTRAGQSFTTLGAVDGDTLASFATIASRPNITALPACVVQMHVHAYKSGGTKTAQLYAEIYSRTSGGIETLLGTTGYTSALTGSSSELTADVTLPYTIFAATDRLVFKIKIHVTGGGSAPDVVLDVEDATVSRLQLGFLP